MANHVRIVRSGASLRTRDRSFGNATIVVSEKPIPRFPLRLAKLNWAIDRSTVVDVKDHRILSARLTKVTIPPRHFIWAPGKGDTFGVAYLLANLCAILGLHVPSKVAATGVVALETNQILGHGLMEDKRQGAVNDGMDHLILPFAAHLMPGVHDGVRYWPARDANEAIFSLLAAASSDIAIPDLKHQWRVKMALSWISFISILAAVCITQLLPGFIAYPTLQK